MDDDRGYAAEEAKFFERYGLAPTERFVDTAKGGRIRMLDVGDGEPIVFVHGTGGPGAYFAPLVATLSGFRSIMIDRPGWGASDQVDFAAAPLGEIAAGVIREVMDGLGLHRADLVGASIGNLWALRFAQAEPARVNRLVLLGAGPLFGEIGVPTFIKLLRSPLGNLIVRLPEKPKMLRKQMAAMGHAASLEAGRISDHFIDWHVAMSKAMGWAKAERAMVKAIVTRSGYASGVLLDGAEIAGIKRPVLMVYGASDPIGSVEIWRRFTDRIPQGELDVVDGAGHVVWLDDPARVGGSVRRFLERNG